MSCRIVVWMFVAAAALGAVVQPAAAQETPLLTAALAEAAALPPAAESQTAAPARAVEYSDAYRMRAKIHRIASFATLPLFATEGVLGQSLYNDPTEGKK